MKKTSLKFLKILLPLIFLGISNLGHTQDQKENQNQSPDWDTIKKTIRALKEKNEIPSWSRKPHFRGRAEIDSFKALNGLVISSKSQEAPELKEDTKGEEISSLLQTRFGDITLSEMSMLQAIINSPNSDSKEHIQQQLVAHGIEHSKGGIRNLINIIIEGRIFGTYMGPLVAGNPALNAGNHGPFFIILEEKQAKKMRSSLLESVHMGYLVPGERHRRKIVSFLKAAQEKGILTDKEAEDLEGKILTYEDFISLAKNHPLSMKDGESFGAALNLNRKKEITNPDIDHSLCLK